MVSWETMELRIVDCQDDTMSQQCQTIDHPFSCIVVQWESVLKRREPMPDDE